MVQILGLAFDGSPQEWLSPDKAAYYMAREAIAWDLGETCMTMRGGYNTVTGEQSILELKPIICIRSSKYFQAPHKSPPLTRAGLLRRDGCMCAYCGLVFREKDLTLDHVHPESRGGETSWTNLLAACGPCNNRKDCRTPEEARMLPLFLPYVPNIFEEFILANRVILADQFKFLLKKVSQDSRLRTPENNLLLS